ncbi:Next to BRCA1 protein 1 protein [Mortierella sp. GBA39]|nr:Next to BRCA1 protein 1 protein [Mortierella sp. GBA39]
MHCIVKASLGGERRRFTFCTLDPANIHNETDKLSFEALHSKVCTLFGQKALMIQYVEQSGSKKLIQRDADVVAAVVSSSGLVSPTATLMVLKLSVTSSSSSTPSEPSKDATIPTTSGKAKHQHRAKEKSETCKKKDTCNKKDTCKNDNAADRKNTCKNNAAKKEACNNKKDVCNKDTREKDACTKPCKKAPSPPKPRCEEVVHSNVLCDVCMDTIKGIRYKCRNCDNYDLCQACHPLAAERYHPKHTFTAIERPLGSSSRSSVTVNSCSRTEVQPLEHAAYCDICTVVITGVRHKCFQCPDYDLCEECLPLAKVHHRGHSFVPISYPGELTFKVDYTPHYGIVCDGCDDEITGIRYKCGNCADYDLCGNCEASPFHRHDPKHIFLKIRRPVHTRMSPAVPLLPMIRPLPTPAPVKDATPEKVNASELDQSDPVVPTVLTVAPTLDEVLTVPFESIKPTEPIEPAVIPTATSEVQSEPETLPEPIFVSKALFVKDININDGTTIQAGSQFLKIWEMSNPGVGEWPKDSVLQFVGGDRMFADVDANESCPHFKISLAPVGESVCVTADLKAPPQPGRYVSYWRLVAPDGEPFGHCIWCDIIVEEGSESSSDSMGSSTMIFPVVDCHDTKKTWSRNPSNPEEVTETGSVRTTTTTNAPSTYTGPVGTAHSVTDDQLSTTSGQYTSHSLASSILGRDESVDDRIDIDNDDISTERFFSDDDEFVVVDTDGEQSEAGFRE